MSLGQELAPHLPFLRRYARALTGSQTHGDAFVHAIRSTANIEEDPEPSSNLDEAEGIAQARLARITPLSRQALLLTAMEGFTPEDAGYLIDASAEDVERLVAE